MNRATQRVSLGAGLARAVLSLALLAMTGAQAALHQGFVIEWPRTDFGQTTIDLAEISSGGPPKDGIPSIDEPRFETPAEAAAWLDPRDPVIALEIDGWARAYPLRILLWHEIINDTLAGMPVSVTYCPLCNAAMVFERRIDGAVLDFGTTGKLRHSDLVMYDRQTESWWQQFTGKGIVGKHAGRELATLPAPIVAFADFRAAHGHGQVLSRNTGFRRDYGRNPYPGYDAPDARPFLLRGSPDPRLPPMQRVLGLDLDGRTVAYALPQLAAKGVVNAVIAETPMVLVARSGTLSALDAERIEDAREIAAAAAYDRRIDGRTLKFEREGRGFRDLETGSTWNLLGHATGGPLRGSRLRQVDRGVHFAFAWLAFHPESELVAGSEASSQDKAVSRP